MDGRKKEYGLTVKIQNDSFILEHLLSSMLLTCCLLVCHPFCLPEEKPAQRFNENRQLAEVRIGNSSSQKTRQPVNRDAGPWLI